MLPSPSPDAVGIITNIQRFSTHDGPGIRTTVFFKGCNLRCRWCHNPETIRPLPQVQYFPDRCTHCLRCVPDCPGAAQQVGDDGRHLFLREQCIGCGRCADVCPAEAMVVTGREIAAEEVVRIAARDRDYYRNSGGGVTLSGGEPLLQPEFAAEILRGCKALDIHTALDTAAGVGFSVLEPLLPLLDLVLLDLKCMDSAVHEAYTGVPNRTILATAGALLESGVPVEVRIPVVTGVNNTVDNARQTAEFLGAHGGARRVKLLPYHAMGQDKAESLGRKAQIFQAPTAEELEAMAGQFDCPVTY